MLLSLGEPAAAVDGKRASRVRSIRRAMTEQVAVKPDLERLLAIATTLDLACARAVIALLGANPPRYIPLAPTAEGVILLVWQQHEQGQPVVPVDLLIQEQIW